MYIQANNTIILFKGKEMFYTCVKKSIEKYIYTFIRFKSYSMSDSESLDHSCKFIINS